jgi:2-hydroxychromene-2-carboxylate isomerase
MAKRPARWYFSFRSPYSWFAYRELTAHHPDVADALAWIPFWEPDEWTARLLAEGGAEFPYTPMSRDKHFYILQDTRRLAERQGVTMTWPIDRDPHWEVAHLTFLGAQAQGRHRAFADLVYRARWEAGANISDPELVSALADQAGLQPGTVDAALSDPLLRAQGVAALAAGARDGVFGVPFFITGRHKFWGIDRLGAFTKLLHHGGGDRPGLPARPEPELVITGRSADGGHAGGCG